MIGETFNLQGHRGARGLVPENTLPSFETALDIGVSSIETDLHLSRDGVVVISHEPAVGQPPRLISEMTLADLRQIRVDRHPDPSRFPHQQATLTPLAASFAAARQIHPYAPPTLDDLLAFVIAYGQATEKSPEQQTRAARVILDLELKRVPARPKYVGDAFDGRTPGLLEERLLEVVARQGMLERIVVRSFDHRSVAVLKLREPRLRTAILVAGTAPVAPEELARGAGAAMYCPEAAFLDELQVRQLHAAGIAVVPWTVNDAADWAALLAWGVDGITTDYPDRLAVWLRQRGVAW